jgi:uncharacterized protein (DUF305 family)
MSHPDRPDAAAPPRARWWAVALILAAVAALAFAGGRFSTFGSQGVAVPTTDSPEAGFARDMQVHHAQAIQLAMEIYRKTSDDELRVLAYDIATGQAGQRGEMYSWLVQWGLSQSGGPMMQWMTRSESHAHGTGTGTAPLTEEEARQAMGLASADEVTTLESATGKAADRQFLRLLIRHHEGAIPMAEALLELGAEPRARQVAQTIKTGQTAEITAMKSLQARIGCAS